MAGILDTLGGIFGGKKKVQGRPAPPPRGHVPGDSRNSVGIVAQVRGHGGVQSFQPAVRQWQAPAEAAPDSGAAMQGAAYNTGGWPNARLQGARGYHAQPALGYEDEPATMYLEEPYY